MSEITERTIQGGGKTEEMIDENDRIIKSIQGKREKFIADLTPNGTFPKDMEDRQALMALMTGAANTALASKKIKSDEKQAASQATILAAMVETTRIMAANASANKRKGSRAEALDVPVREIRKVDGQTDIGTKPVSTSAVALGSTEIFVDQ